MSRIFCSALLLSVLSLSAWLTPDASAGLVLDSNGLQRSKAAYERGEFWAQRTVDRLISQADHYTRTPNVSVLDDNDVNGVPPRGGPNDFMNGGAYWWPNPDTPSGLPYVFRDGFSNPNSAGDYRALRTLSRSVELMSLAYHFTGEERYAKKTASMLRTFFLDPATRMNPSIRHTQIIPGVRDKGITEFVGFRQLGRPIFDAATLIESSPSWTANDMSGLKDWARQLRDFAVDSPEAKRQRDSITNHGTAYDITNVFLSVYIEDFDAAHRGIETYLDNRLDKQIADDGSNPVEMLRSNNQLYHRLNLQMLFDLADLSEHLDDIDLWSYETEDGRSLRLAFDFMEPYLLGEKEWTFFPREEFPSDPQGRILQVLRRAAVGFNDPEILTTAEAFADGSLDSHISHLLYPSSAVSVPEASAYSMCMILFSTFVAGSWWSTRHRRANASTAD